MSGSLPERSSADLEFAEALCRGWVRLYTSFLHVEVRQARRAELESDQWEHRRHALVTGTPPTATAVELLVRLLLGIPDDLLWRFGAAVAASRAAHYSDMGDRSWVMKISSKAGPITVLSGVLVALLVAFILVTVQIFPGEGELPRPLEILFWTLAAATGLVGMATVLGLLALERNGRAARLGLWGFMAGAGVGVVVAVLAIVRAPGPWWLLLAPAYLMAFVGWMTFAVINLRARALPRWNGLPLVVGMIPVGITALEWNDVGSQSLVLSTGIVVFAAGWLLLGYAVWKAPDHHELVG